MPDNPGLHDGAFRVLKLGGSLLDWPAWPDALKRWRAAQPPMRDVLIVGGGAWADLIREADAQYALGEETSHWLCLRLMSVTARLAHALLPDSELVETWAGLDSAGPALTIADSLPLIEHAEREQIGPPLPHTWDVTSDSIAAWLAERLGAAELVLLKSQLPRVSHTRMAASQCGYVDRFFVDASRDLPRVRCVNLRSSDTTDMILSADAST